MDDVINRMSWLEDKMTELTRDELADMVKEIQDFRKEGVLVGGMLRALEHMYSDEVTHTRYGEMLRAVEDAVLFECARRYMDLAE